MSATTATKLARQVIRSSPRLPLRSLSALTHHPTTTISTSIQGPRVSLFRPNVTHPAVPARSFSTTPPLPKGLSPESENPPAKDDEAEPEAVASPADISAERYHELSDDYMNALVEKLEQLQEENEEIDVEYTAGVLTLAFPPNGTYVINKQPPNKQIWLSSPITGPKRYDYVLFSEGQDAKEGTGRGEWVYIRDGSTLTGLLQTEVGVDMSDPYAPVPHSGE